MADIFDILIVGLGANGSSAAYHLSKTGLSVCGIDRFIPPHTYGSSHGQSRIIRQAYYENPLYVPFVREAYRLWHELEEVSGRRLLRQTGGLMLGNPEAAVIRGSRHSAEQHGIPFEYLRNEALRERFPALIPTRDTVGLLEKEAGILFPETCIQSFLDAAGNAGVSLRCHERVLAILPGPDHVEVVTDKSRYRAGQVILSAGAWVNDLLPQLRLPLTIERQVLYWFRNNDPARQSYVSPDRLPVFIWEYAPAQMFYGFPDLGEGIKIAYHHAGRPVQPDGLTPAVAPEEIEAMTGVAARYFDIDAVFHYATTCLYTNTPDFNFIIDRHPLYPNICIASPCSGHGFKFSSLTGRICASLVLGEPMPFDLSPFRIERFF